MKIITKVNDDLGFQLSPSHIRSRVTYEMRNNLHVLKYHRQYKHYRLSERCIIILVIPSRTISNLVFCFAWFIVKAIIRNCYSIHYIYFLFLNILK